MLRAAFLAGWFATALALLAGAAVAADMPKAVVAVLDYQYVMRESAAAKDIRRQIQVYREAYQDQIGGEEEALKREEQALKQQRTVLTPEAFEEKRREFERKVIDVQRQVQDRSRLLDRSFNAAMNQVQEAVVPIVSELTTKIGFNVVVDKSQVLFANKSLDITEQVVAELDKRLPKVKVPKPAE